MHLIPFYELFPEVAEKETRVLTTFERSELPADTYGLLEFYCPDPECDCRRVMLNVVSEKHLERGFLASVSYGFDPDDEMAGPFLDPLNPQTEYAETLLEYVEFVLADADYVARLERHYAMVKEAAADPTHPAYRRAAELKAERERPAPAPPARHAGVRPRGQRTANGSSARNGSWGLPPTRLPQYGRAGSRHRP